MAKLPNAPLQEAVFEVRWLLDVDPDSQQERDREYDLAQGKFQFQAKDSFPVHKRILASFPNAQNYKIAHQFWSGAQQHFPVLQLGPGVFTVNDTDINYDWENNFFPLIKESLDWLYKAYDSQLQPNYVNLRYIDSVELDKYDFDDQWLVFIRDNLKVDLTNRFLQPGQLNHISINQSFSLDERSELNIAIHSAQNKQTGRKLLIWQTGVVVTGDFDRDAILNHVSIAHEHTSKLFREMTKGPFYASFS